MWLGKECDGFSLLSLIIMNYDRRMVTQYKSKQNYGGFDFYFLFVIFYLVLVLALILWRNL